MVIGLCSIFMASSTEKKCQAPVTWCCDFVDCSMSLLGSSRAHVSIKSFIYSVDLQFEQLPHEKALHNWHPESNLASLRGVRLTLGCSWIAETLENVSCCHNKHYSFILLWYWLIFALRPHVFLIKFLIFTSFRQHHWVAIWRTIWMPASHMTNTCLPCIMVHLPNSFALSVFHISHSDSHFVSFSLLILLAQLPWPPSWFPYLCPVALHLRHPLSSPPVIYPDLPTSICHVTHHLSPVKLPSHHLETLTIIASSVRVSHML